MGGAFFSKPPGATPLSCKRKIVTSAIVAPLMSRVASLCVMRAPPLFALRHANSYAALPMKLYMKRENTMEATSFSPPPFFSFPLAGSVGNIYLSIRVRLREV